MSKSDDWKNAPDPELDLPGIKHAKLWHLEILEAPFGRLECGTALEEAKEPEKLDRAWVNFVTCPECKKIASRSRGSKTKAKKKVAKKAAEASKTLKAAGSQVKDTSFLCVNGTQKRLPAPRKPTSPPEWRTLSFVRRE